MRLVPAPVQRGWMGATDEQFAKRCLPLLMANQAGWHLLNDREVTVEWDGGSGPGSVVVRHAEAATDARDGRLLPDQERSMSHFGYGIVTWQVPYLFRTPPGFNLLVRGPANEPKDGIQALEGLVETDWAVATFTVNWKLTRVGVPVTFAVDEPIALLVPQRRGELAAFSPEVRDASSDPELDGGYKAWFDSRTAFVAGQRAGLCTKAEWQKHYARGRAPGGEEAPEHELHMRLRAFESLADDPG